MMLTFSVPLVPTVIDGEVVNVAGLAGGDSLLALVPAPLHPLAVRLLPAVGVAVVVDEYDPVPMALTAATRN
jgi:hypothetical protein